MKTIEQPRGGDPEVSVTAVAQRLYSGWRWLAAGGVGGLLIAIGLLAISPVLYEATGIVQLGRVQHVGQSNLAFIEPPSAAVQRIRFPSFIEEILRTLEWDRDRAEPVRTSLSAKVSRNTDLIEVTVRGRTRDDALRALTTTVQYLSVVHQGLAEPTMKVRRRELENLRTEIGTTEKWLKELDRTRGMQNASPPHERFAESLLFQQLAMSKEQRLSELRDREMLLNEWLNSSDVVNTTLVNKWITNYAVLPGRLVIILLGLLVGLLVGTLPIVFSHDMRRAKRTAPDARLQ